MSLTAAYDAIAANKEAEFRVESSIAVREQYKTKLLVLIDALQPSAQLRQSIPATKSASTGQRGTSGPSLKSTTDASKKKQNRDAIADRLRVRATMPAGKELQVVGDWLLLLRAASVNVVESVAHWRRVIHQDRPVPFDIDHRNYLLQMAHDADFLSQCSDLVAWLGFGLVRNPFIVPGGLDGGATNGSSTVSVSSSKKERDASKQFLPPSTLVKPLVNITPEDDVVDGSRIEQAQAILKHEEALYGRARLAQLVEPYLSKPLDDSLLALPVFDDDDQQNGQTMSTIFDHVAAQTKMLRRSEHHLGCLLREQARTSDVVKLIEDQIRLTSLHRNHDLVGDHCVWQFRDKCRASTLRSSENARDQMMSRLESLRVAITNSQATVSKQRNRLDQLVAEKDHARQRRQAEKRQVEAETIAHRKAAIRHKTVERNRAFKSKRIRKNADADEYANQDAPASQSHQAADEDIIDNIATSLGCAASPNDRRIELDQTRTQNLELLRQQRVYREQMKINESCELNRRRDENAQMFLEDRLSWLVEARRRIIIRDRLRRERVKQLTANPICSVVQTIGGVGSNSDKKFVVSVYDSRAKGYAPEGLRFVAYDPMTSTSLSLLISTREYNNLGYGRTFEGLTGFCQWLCIIYEKRTRQFKLVWSGAPCPPPLRVREYDHALVCVHKEGIRLSWQSGIEPSYAPFYFAAAYIRTNDPSKLHFVLSPVKAGADITEFAVRGPELLPAWSLVLRSEGEDRRGYVSWLHALGEEGEDSFMTASGNGTGATRVFSGEMPGIDGKKLTRVHIFDVSSTEYELHFASPRLNELESLPHILQPIVLLKRAVNPYRVRLPSSAFGDLIGCLRLEHNPCATNDSNSPNMMAVILPSWRARLARYVRAIRMARFGCKVDGVFHFVVVTLVQQKTEFRAHLAFELTSVGEVGSRYSLRISLSQFMRCRDASSLLRQSRIEDVFERARMCTVCLDNSRRFVDVDHERSLREDAQSMSEDSQVPCSSCVATQTARLAILRSLIDTGTLESESALGTLYYGVCSVCEAMPPPIAIVIPTRIHRTDAEECDPDENFLSHYFTCFDEAADFTNDGAMRICHALEQTRLCVIRVRAAPIATNFNAVSVTNRLSQLLHLEEHNDFSVTFAVVYRELDIFELEGLACDSDSSSDIEFVKALHDTATSILQVGEMIPVAHDGTEDDQESISNFEGYLVSEALLVEATRVILQPNVQWRIPGETVGASSWDTACEFLRNPQQLARNLQHRHQTILTMNPYARNIIDAYTAHPKWPTSFNDVRAPFQALLSCMLHIRYVQHLLDTRGDFLPLDSEHFIDCTPANLVDNGVYALRNEVKAIIIRRLRGQAFCVGQLQQDASVGSIE